MTHLPSHMWHYLSPHEQERTLEQLSSAENKAVDGEEDDKQTLKRLEGIVASLCGFI